MKIAHRDADRFVRRPDSKIFAVLLYGPDQSLVVERAEKLRSATIGDSPDPFSAINITPAMLKEDPVCLHDEANTLSFTGGRRFIRVRGAGDSLSKLLDEYLNSPSSNAVVVFEADELPPRSPLRKLCEKHSSVAAIACYPPEDKELLNIAEQMFVDRGITIEKGALALFGRNVSPDRGVLQQEVDKLSLYIGKNKTVTEENVSACLAGSISPSLDKLVIASGAGSIVDADIQYQIALAEGISEVAILRFMQRHFQRLDWVVTQIEAGTSIASAMGGLKPPIFFKFKNPFERQARKWNSQQVQKALSILSDAEIACKRTGSLVRLICGRAIIVITNMGR